MSSNWQNISLRNFSNPSIFLIFRRKKSVIIKTQLIILISGFFFFGCSYKNKSFKSARKYSNGEVWKQSNSRIIKYVRVYKKNKHVKICLDRATTRRYLYYIHRVFYQYDLPPELAYLPILESCFDYKADSGSALGMWQFTKATAKDFGLEVGMLSDDRLNWRKSTNSAALYLKKLGERFDYNWELALAGYNGGPNYMEKQIRSQGTRDFWKLKLRKETHEYVPKFLAMLSVARSRYPELYFKGAPRAWAKSG